MIRTKGLTAEARRKAVAHVGVGAFELNLHVLDVLERENLGAFVRFT